MKRLLTLTVGLLLTISACGGDDDDEGGEEGDVPKIECGSAGTIPKYSELTFLLTTCATCHSTQLTGTAARRDANPAFNYDTYEAAKAGAAKGVEEVYEGPNGAMPPDGTGVPKLTDAQRVQFNTWTQCGMPQ